MKSFKQKNIQPKEGMKIVVKHNDIFYNATIETVYNEAKKVLAKYIIRNTSNKIVEPITLSSFLSGSCHGDTVTHGIFSFNDIFEISEIIKLESIGK